MTSTSEHRPGPLGSRGRARVAALALLLLPSLGCGASRYAMLAGDFAQASANPDARQPFLRAEREPGGQPVLVQPRKMWLERAVPASGGRMRLPPRRPMGHLVAGIITGGLGLALMGAGLGISHCPPGYLCEQGIAVAAILGIGAPHVLIGGIFEIVAAARWSPEVSAPAR